MAFGTLFEHFLYYCVPSQAILYKARGNSLGFPFWLLTTVLKMLEFSSPSTLTFLVRTVKKVTSFCLFKILSFNFFFYFLLNTHGPAKLSCKTWINLICYCLNIIKIIIFWKYFRVKPCFFIVILLLLNWLNWLDQVEITISNKYLNIWFLLNFVSIYLYYYIIK
jgi:hypothetical protein